MRLFEDSTEIYGPMSLHAEEAEAEAEAGTEA
ncbi:hypothetical protein SVIOM342S_10049 [Streptomyces violaceorubidus]